MLDDLINTFRSANKKQLKRFYRKLGPVTFLAKSDPSFKKSNGTLSLGMSALDELLRYHFSAMC